MYEINKQNEKINIIRDVNSCDYLPRMKDYIINMITQIIDFPKKSIKPKYLVQNKDNEKTIMIYYVMSIPYMQRNYSVPIKIYINKNVPSLPPQFNIEVAQGFAVNYNNRNILPNSTTIMTQTLHNWNTYSSIDNVMQEIFMSFSQIFPVYRPEPNASNRNQNQSSFNYNNNYNNYNNNNYGNNNYNNMNQYNPYNNAMQNNPYQQRQNNNYGNYPNLDNNNNNNFNRSLTLNDNRPNINLDQEIKGNKSQNANANNPNLTETENINKKNKIEPKEEKTIDEKISNEKLSEENNNNEKNEKEFENKNEEEINEYRNKISELERKLSEAEKLNESLLKKLNEEIQLKEDLRKTILDKDKIITEFKEKNQSLEEYIKKLNEAKNYSLDKNKNLQDQDKFKSQFNESSDNKGVNNEKPFAINFISLDQKIHYPLSCKNSDLISRLEEELYSEYQEYKEYNTFLTVNGNLVKRFKTVGENKIKKGDAILVNIYE